MSEITIRPLTPADRDGWWRLFQQYVHFYRTSVTDAVAEAAFDRLSGPVSNMQGLVAVDANDTVLGIANLVFHPSTWSSAQTCYLEDLFVDPAVRGSGIARALINAIYELAPKHGADRVYWLTQVFNAPARALYDTVAHNTSYAVYEHEL